MILLRLNPHFYLFDHSVELLLTLFVGLGVDVVGFALTLCVGGRIASLVEVIVSLFSGIRFINDLLERSLRQRVLSQVRIRQNVDQPQTAVGFISCGCL